MQSYYHSHTREFYLHIFSCTVLHVEVNCQCTAQAPIVGTNRERADTADTGTRFYLNTAAPAPCNGTINGWRYCFYKPSDIRNDRTYITTFAAYRATVTGYQRVSNVTVISWSGRNISVLSQNFNCFNISVSGFTIEAGDIVGGCVYDPAGRSTRQLDIVSRNAAGYSLMRRNDESQCRQNSLPMSISRNQLNRNILNSRILHVYANITGRYNTSRLLLSVDVKLYNMSCFLYSYEYSYNPPSYNYNVHN